MKVFKEGGAEESDATERCVGEKAFTLNFQTTWKLILWLK